MTGTALAERPDTDLSGDRPSSGVVWTHERIQTLRATLAKDCTPAQFELALAFCQRTGLDPFLRQAHIVVRQGQLTLQIGIDGHRAIALRSGVYAGEEGPLYCGKDGVYTDSWVQEGPPKLVRFTVWRHDYERPFTAIIDFKEFESLGGALWQKAPLHMSGIRAASHAYRKAFQQELASHARVAQAMGVAMESSAESARELDVEPGAVRALESPAAPQARVVEAKARPATPVRDTAVNPRRGAYLKRIEELRQRLRELHGMEPREAPANATLAELEALGRQLREAVDAAEAGGEDDELGIPESEWEPEPEPEPVIEFDASDEAQRRADYARQYEQLRADCQALDLDPPALTDDMTAHAVADLHLHWSERKAEAEDALAAEMAGKPKPARPARPAGPAGGRR